MATREDPNLAIDRRDSLRCRTLSKCRLRPSGACKWARARPVSQCHLSTIAFIRVLR